ncbi:hypothetical protein E4U42_005797 [Claviceps africana]|uniref:F-box domain-containing protein n=1 Tax=Claviceps africana TaxID=83212 RepID=A0A8K0J3S7_9HYPO|nr:hypothetical protein E4U42_005797 [Claviceps africana]
MADCSPLFADSRRALHRPSYPTTSRHGPGRSVHPSPARCSRRAARQSLQKLSCEVLILVLEQLRVLDARAIFTVRSVCRIFDALATPIAYRRVALNEKIVQPDAPRRFPSAWEHISAYTNHVMVRSNLRPSGIRRILSGITRLSSVTYVLLLLMA